MSSRAWGLLEGCNLSILLTVCGSFGEKDGNLELSS